MYFTGIGSRSSPNSIYPQIFELSKILVKKGYILRSGAADGSDTFWELAYTELGGKKEIYLPWKGFNHNSSELYHVSEEAFEIAATIHPAWYRLSWGAKKLHGRNIYQVLGLDLKTPSKFVICWTENGLKKGGTATAITLAERNNIPVYNLAIDGTYDKLMKICKEL